MATSIKSLKPIGLFGIPNLLWNRIGTVGESPKIIVEIELREGVPVEAIKAFMVDINTLKGVNVTPVDENFKVFKVEYPEDKYMLIYGDEDQRYLSLHYCKVEEDIEMSLTVIPNSQKMCEVKKDTIEVVQYSRETIVSRLVMSLNVPHEVVRDLCKSLSDEFGLRVDYDEDTNIIEMLDKYGNRGLICIEKSDSYILLGADIMG